MMTRENDQKSHSSVWKKLVMLGSEKWFQFGSKTMNWFTEP